MTGVRKEFSGLWQSRSAIERVGMIGKIFYFGASGAMTAQHAMHCEAARILSERMGLDAETCRGVLHNNEHWDGKGSPNGIAG